MSNPPPPAWSHTQTHTYTIACTYRLRLRPDGALNYSLTNSVVRELLCALLAVSYPLLLSPSLLFLPSSLLSLQIFPSTPCPFHISSVVFNDLLFCLRFLLLFKSLHVFSLLLSPFTCCSPSDLHTCPLWSLGKSHHCIIIVSAPLLVQFADIFFC